MAGLTREQRAERDAKREETRDETREPEGRESRVPVGVQRLKMATPERKGYIRRWVNDEMDGRIQRFKAGGYQFVEDSNVKIGEQAESGNRHLGSAKTLVVGTHPNGEPKLAYLMEIKKEFYDEDQRAKAKINNEIDEAIKAGSLANNVPTADRYTPTDGRKFENI